MISLSQFDSLMKETLLVDHLPQYVGNDALQNGLQSWGSEEITKIGFAVSANMSTFQKAVEADCQALIVHHGMWISGNNLDRFTFERIKYLVENKLSVWSAHYLLDAHPTLGNNAKILEYIGTTSAIEPFVDFSGAPWGYIAELETPLSFKDIQEKVSPVFSPRSLYYNFSEGPIKRIAAVSGKGAPRNFADMHVLKDAGVDLYITGELHEWNREMFRETGISCIGGGHYHTEVFGPQALMKYVEDNWDCTVEWINDENDV